MLIQKDSEKKDFLISKWQEMVSIQECNTQARSSLGINKPIQQLQGDSLLPKQMSLKGAAPSQRATFSTEWMVQEFKSPIPLSQLGMLPKGHHNFYKINGDLAAILMYITICLPNILPGQSPGGLLESLQTQVSMLVCLQATQSRIDGIYQIGQSTEARVQRQR